MIITIVGGGSTFTAGIVKSIALRKAELEVEEIRLFDIDKERQDRVAVLVKWILEEDLKSGIRLTVSYDPAEAYKDADFIFAQMRVGKYAMRELDEKIPLRHGCVGQETCGCGGLAYGMRTIFPMMKVIDDAEKYAKPSHQGQEGDRLRLLRAEPFRLVYLDRIPGQGYPGRPARLHYGA